MSTRARLEQICDRQEGKPEVGLDEIIREVKDEIRIARDGVKLLKDRVKELERQMNVSDLWALLQRQSMRLHLDRGATKGAHDSLRMPPSA